MHIEDEQLQKLKELRDKLPADQPLKKKVTYLKTKEEIFQLGIEDLKKAMIPDLRLAFSGVFLINVKYRENKYKPIVMKGSLHLKAENGVIVSVKEFISKNCLQQKSNDTKN